MCSVWMSCVISVALCHGLICQLTPLVHRQPQTAQLAFLPQLAVGSTATQEEEVTVTNPGARTNPGVRTNPGAGTIPGVRTNPGARTNTGVRTNLLSSVSLTPTQEKTK